MGRSQRRKQDKNFRHKDNIIDEDKIFTLGTLIKIIVVCATILVAFYLVLAIFVTKEFNLSSNNKNNDNSESTASDNSSVSNKILASKIFDQQEDSYYVYFYDFNKEDEKLQSSISNLTDGTIYRVNTSDGLNSNYVANGDSGNSKATGLNDLKVINPTLIKVSNDKITSYYEGVGSILSFINK